MNIRYEKSEIVIKLILEVKATYSNAAKEIPENKENQKEMRLGNI